MATYCDPALLARSFTVFPKNMTLEGAQWEWHGANDEAAAELMNGKDFNVFGKFDTSKLTPGQTYEVFFQIMMKNNATGFEVPVKLELSLPNGITLPNQENLSGKPVNTFIDIKVSSFKANYGMTGMTGEIKFSMYQFGDQLMKKGLVIKSATIRPASY